MFNRKIRCKFELLKEKSNFNPDTLFTAEYFFSAGEKVGVRNYVGKDKWLFGTIKERIGDLHYLVELENGTICKRYSGQIVKTGNNLINFKDLDYFIPLQDSIASHNIDNAYNVAQPIANNVQDNVEPILNAEPQNIDNVVNPQRNEIITRSGRVSKIPIYLQNNYILNNRKS